MPTSDSSETMQNSVILGAVFSVLAALFTVPIGFADHSWLWATVPAAVTFTLAVLIGAIVAVAERSGGFRRVAIGMGLLLGLAAGAALIWAGVVINLRADVCDPQVSRCVTVVNGVARGASTESAGDQRFSTFLLSLIAIGPGLMILYFAGRGAVRFVRPASSRGTSARPTSSRGNSSRPAAAPVRGRPRRAATDPRRYSGRSGGEDDAASSGSR
jgi:hypothetical protein